MSSCRATNAKVIAAQYDVGPTEFNELVKAPEDYQLLWRIAAEDVSPAPNTFTFRDKSVKVIVKAKLKKPPNSLGKSK